MKKGYVPDESEMKPSKGIRSTVVIQYVRRGPGTVEENMYGQREDTALAASDVWCINKVPDTH